MSHKTLDHFRSFDSVCPFCESEHVKRVNYTFWGGVIGPRIFNLHRCEDCNAQYNAKTGQRLAPMKIALYLAGVVVITVLIAFFFFL